MNLTGIDGELNMSSAPDLNVFRSDRPGIRKVLGDLEAEIMELIWARAPRQGTTVRDVFESLYERRHLAYTTVMSTMARLARKRLLRVEKADPSYVYYPNFTRDEFVSGFVRRILEDLLVSFSGPLQEALETLPDARAAGRVRQLLDEISRRRTSNEEDK